MVNISILLSIINPWRFEMKHLKKFWNDEGGLTMVEYGLMAAAIAVILLAGFTVLTQAVDDRFRNLAGNIEP